MVPEAVIWPVRLLHPVYVDQKKGDLQFRSDIARSECRTQFMLGHFGGWHLCEVEVISPNALEGSNVSLSTCWGDWEIPAGF